MAGNVIVRLADVLRCWVIWSAAGLRRRRHKGKWDGLDALLHEERIGGGLAKHGGRPWEQDCEESKLSGETGIL